MSKLSDFNNELNDIERRIKIKNDKVAAAFNAYEAAQQELFDVMQERVDLMKKYQPEVAS
jgi:hypothetical protein